MNRYLFIALFSLILAGCSNKELYEAGQGYQKSDCINKATSESQHMECLKAEKKPYEDYEKERKSIVKK